MKKLIIVMLFLFGFLSMGFSQTLDEYLKVAAEHNPELKAYFHDYMATMQRVPQVGALPDPELSVGFFLQPMERFMGNEQANFQLMQMFPWFGMLGTQKDEASKMALARYEVFRDAKNSLFYQVKNNWYELYRLEEEIRITKENMGILKKYERLALIRFQSAGTSSTSGSTGSTAMPGNTGQSLGSSMNSMGSGMNTGSTSATANAGTVTQAQMGSSASMGTGSSGMSDVLRVRMEIKELENTLALLESSRKPLQVMFNTLLNRNINDSITIADTLAIDAFAIDRLILLDSITQNNPMLKMLDAEEEAYESQKRMTKLQGRPMFGVGVEYMLLSPRVEDGMSMGGHDMVMPMVSLTIPIYRKKYGAMQKEAEFKQLAVQQRREKTANQLAVEWSTALRDLDDANRRSKLYEEQSDLAKQTLDLLMTAYATNGRDFEEVLRVQQQLLDYRLQLVNAIVDQHNTIALLENLAATELN